MAWVYSFDDEWYYLYKQDTEKYRVKRRKDLEGIESAFTYEQHRKKHINNQSTRQSPKGRDARIAEMNDTNIQEDSTLDISEQNSGMQMSGV